MSMPVCSKCGEDRDVDIVTPCPQCKGEQAAGDADCWLCLGMGQVPFSVCGCVPATGCWGTLESDPIGWCSTHGGWVTKCPPHPKIESCDDAECLCYEPDLGHHDRCPAKERE